MGWSYPLLDHGSNPHKRQQHKRSRQSQLTERQSSSKNPPDQDQQLCRSAPQLIFVSCHHFGNLKLKTLQEASRAPGGKNRLLASVKSLRKSRGGKHSCLIRHRANAPDIDENKLRPFMHVRDLVSRRILNLAI